MELLHCKLCMYIVLRVETSRIMFKDFNTHLSMLIAHKLKIEAVQRRTSNDIQISHKIHPNGHEPKNNNSNIMFQQALNWILFQEKHYQNNNDNNKLTDYKHKYSWR